MNIENYVYNISGIGNERSKQLSKLGIRTIYDLLTYYPRAYENRGNVRLLKDASDEETFSYVLTVATSVKTSEIMHGLTISKFRAFDDSGSCEITYFNTPYIKDLFCVGCTFRFYGKAVIRNKKIELINPKYDQIFINKPLSDLIPVYSLTEGLSSKMLSKWIMTAINEYLPSLVDPLPNDVSLRQGLPSLSYAIKEVHFPSSKETLEKAVRRLSFDEMFSFGLAVSKSAKENRSGDAPCFSKVDVKPFLSLLPYELTCAQKNAVNEIYRDMTRKDENGKTSPMTRILVGDVGSGKTVCAALSMYITAKNGYQSVLMAPTEILARQHYEDFSSKFSKLGIKVELLLGATTQKNKNLVYESVSNGVTDILIGTHAVLSDKLTFSKLGLIVTDEQHRFGVKQRAILKNKTECVHMLVMSATPIPRTLALSLYGDLDVSKINEMPKGRIRVDTYVVDETYRERLNAFIQKNVNEGGQVYIVTPSIEAEEDQQTSYEEAENSAQKPDIKNALDYAKELQKALPDLQIEVLHGKMKSKEKDEIMSRFVSGATQVLISTTVIEVGVNVPNSTLMIIENADRFGLSQLHQLRGRVGRGNKKSYCILVSSANNDRAKERLEIMKTTFDGFEIAEKDLLMRGPGDFFSSLSDENIRQSGGFDFRFSSMIKDTTLMNEAFAEAKQILQSDPELQSEEHFRLKEMIDKLYQTSPDTIS